MISNVTKPAISLVKLAHSLIEEKVKSGAIVIDATVGNGHDTRFLLDLDQPNGKVFGFDIQQAALDSARNRLQEQVLTDRLTLIRASHADMKENIPLPYHGSISAVMFNLGYLPGGDKRIITQTDSTLAGLASAIQLLSVDGIITILAYPGHEGGEMEAKQVNNWRLALDPAQFQVELFESHPGNPSAPKLYAVYKIR